MSSKRILNVVILMVLIAGTLPAMVVAAPPASSPDGRPAPAVFTGTAETATAGPIARVTVGGVAQASWVLRAPSPVATMDNVVLWTPIDGGLWTVGGYGAAGATQRYDPNTDAWTTHAAEPVPTIAYAVDGCYGFNDVGEEIIVLFPDATGSVSGVLHRYNVTNDAWDTPPTPVGFPATGIWGHDIVSMASITGENVCYLSGGATVPGGGNLTDLWAYYPDSNTVVNLGPYTHIPNGFDFHASWWVPWLGGMGAICVGGGVDAPGAAYADTQCYWIAEQIFGAPNADLGLLPQQWWGMADGWKLHGGEYQIWLVNGVDAAGALLQASAYMDPTTGGFVYGPVPAVASYRLEGDDWQGHLYAEQGSAGGFTPTTDNQYLQQEEGPPCTWVDLVVDDFEGGMGNWTMTGLWNEEHEADPCGSLAAPFPSSDTDAYFGQDGICTYGTGAPEAGVLEMVFDVDTTVAVETTLDFWSFEQTECGGGSCGYDDRLVEVSLDGGATWDTVWSSPGPEMQWYPAGVDLTPYRGLLRVRFRFDTYDDLYNDFFGWMVDDVVLAACIPEDLGWLDGSVMDSELGDTEPPCTGAVVQVEPGGVEIPVRDDGTYGPSMLISGTYTLTATAPGFSVETAIVDITTDMTTTQDFNLWRPVIEVTPTDLISITGYVGYTETYPLVISNNGHLPLDFEIYELAPPAAAVEAARSYRPSPAAVGVDPFIYEQLAASPDGQVDFFVAFRDTADLGPAYSMNWSDRGHFVVEALQRAAHAAQGNVRAWLDEHGVEYTSYWINNTLFLHADETTMNALAAFPEVSGFRGNHVNQIMPVEAPETAGQTLTPAYPWNITFPMADQVHSLFGIKGQGVVVGGMDTGVEYDHMGLVNNYRGNLGGGSFDHTYSWFDPDNACPDPDEPCDTDGHGTRTHGIMTGDDDPALPDGAWIGMAPDAQWIHCLGCPYGSCPDSVTDACAQWFLAPGGDPDMRPQVVNHSWGLWSPNDCNGNAFQAQLMAYRAADIVPAFAAGNVGDQVIPPHCYASTSPANNTDPDGNPIAFSSGAHGASGLIDSYSSGGPSACNNDNLFPDVASPGLGSCTTQLGNSYYCGFGGTSAASPHTAGCVALVRAANPVLTVDEVEQVIRDAANDVDDGCGTPPESPDWNNIYGEGHLDCFEAVEMVLQQDIPWIWEDPISGTIPAEDDVTIDVSATCTETGDLSATLRIMHNDPCLETIDVPVVLHCEEPMPDLYITKEVTPVHQVPGGLVTYTIAFGNDGSGDAMGVVVSDVLPAEVEYISSDPPGAYDAGTHELVWGPLDLERFGSPIEATVVVRIGEEVEPCTWMTNTVYLLWEAEEHMAEASHHAEEPPPPPFFYYYLPMLYKNG
jgi:uncharacterized repeat protein (TIGR01451 family)